MIFNSSIFWTVAHLPLHQTPNRENTKNDIWSAHIFENTLAITWDKKLTKKSLYFLWDHKMRKHACMCVCSCIYLSIHDPSMHYRSTKHVYDTKWSHILNKTKYINKNSYQQLIFVFLFCLFFHLKEGKKKKLWIFPCISQTFRLNKTSNLMLNCKL